MASASVQPSALECPVCHENFTTPKILPCAHLLCRQCLITWLKTETDAQCPLCRDVIVDATEKAAKTCAVIADSLPTDLAMEARVECAAILSKDHVCCSCRNTAAKCICLNCGDTYCGTCATFHQNMASSRHHKVEDLSSMTAERLATTRQLPCSVHADKTSEIYCPTHGAAICHLCATTKHRACPEVTELDDKMEEARQVLAELAATLKAGESRLEREINELDRCLQDMEKATLATLTDIDQKCDRLQSRVEACRQRLKKLANGAIAEAKDSVQKKKSRLQGQRGKVTSHHRLVDDTSQALSRACLLGDSASMLKKRVSDLDLNLNSANSGDIVAMAKLTIDSKVLDNIEKELAELGQVEREAATASTDQTTWRFHTNHGKDIVLSNNQQTAERTKPSDEHGVVLSSEAMRTQMLYEVRVEKVAGTAGCLVCGVITQNPDSVTLPAAVPCGWEPAVVIADTGVVWDHGPGAGCTAWRSTDVGKQLRGLQTGRRAGLLLDTAGLHLYIDGVDQGIVVNSVKQPCYVFFECYSGYEKLTTLPLKKIG